MSAAGPPREDLFALVVDLVGPGTGTPPRVPPRRSQDVRKVFVRAGAAHVRASGPGHSGAPTPQRSTDTVVESRVSARFGLSDSESWAHAAGGRRLVASDDLRLELQDQRGEALRRQVGVADITVSDAAGELEDLLPCGWRFVGHGWFHRRPGSTRERRTSMRGPHGSSSQCDRSSVPNLSALRSAVGRWLPACGRAPSVVAVVGARVADEADRASCLT